MTGVSRLLAYVSLIFAVLYTLAALSPSHYNWGFHHAAFVPPAVGLVCLGIILSLLIPFVRRATLTFLGGITRRFTAVPTIGIFILLAAVVIGLGITLPARIQLLGDSDLILSLTPTLPSIEDVSANFRNQPLTHQLLRLTQYFIGSGDAVAVAQMYRVADIISGICFTGVALFFIGRLKIPPLEGLLIGMILFFHVGTLFFFGYVENYMFFYTGLTAYIATGWLAADGKISRIVPVIFAALLPGFHIVGVVFLPTTLILLAPYWKTHRKIFITTAGAAIAAVAIALITTDAGSSMTGALTYNILPPLTPPGGVPYGVFSVLHLIDWINANLHIAPFALVVIGTGVVMLPRDGYPTDPVFRFLAASSFTGLIVTIVILPGLGMARDWDMLSNFFIPLNILMAYILIGFMKDRGARHGVLLIAVISMIHWGIWIGLNAIEESHLERAEVLTAPELSGTFPKIYYEGLGKTFYKRKDHAKSARWYERYVAIDSTNPRILTNLSEAYRGLGDEEKFTRMLELSAAADSKNPGVYSNLSVHYVNVGDTAKAIELLRKAIEIDPKFSAAHANMSLLYWGQRKIAESLTHSELAISLGMREPVLFKISGYAAFELGRKSEAVSFFKSYIALAPGDRAVIDLLARIESGQSATVVTSPR